MPELCLVYLKVEVTSGGAAGKRVLYGQNCIPLVSLLPGRWGGRGGGGRGGGREGRMEGGREGRREGGVGRELGREWGSGEEREGGRKGMEGREEGGREGGREGRKASVFQGVHPTFFLFFCLLLGIKFVPLRTTGGELIPESGLFLRIAKEEEGGRKEGGRKVAGGRRKLSHQDCIVEESGEFGRVRKGIM